MENIKSNNKYYNSNKKQTQNVNFSENDEIISYEKEKPVYYTDYKREVKSIKGSGTTSSIKNKTTNSTTGTVNQTFPKNKKVTPPLRQMALSKQPLEVNAAFEPRNPYIKSYKIKDYYYTTQQYDDPIPYKEEDDDKEEDIKDKKDKSTKDKKDLDQTAYVPKYKRWNNNHFIYSMEPRFNDVVTPVRAYTWMYPFSPNTEDYYIDNINNTPPPTPLLYPDFYKQNDIGTYQQSLQKTNTKETFSNMNNTGIKCIQNYNIIYFIIIVIILSIYFNRK